MGGGYVPESCPATATSSSALFGDDGCNSCGTCGTCAPCDPVYGPACPPNYCSTPCFSPCYPCCPLLTIISVPFRIVENLWMCAAGHWPNTGCSQVYWGDWSDPPACADPCSFNTYTGPCSSRVCGATACNGTVGCSSCGDCGGEMTFPQGEITTGEVIYQNAPMPAPTTAVPGRPRVIAPSPAPTPAPAANTSGCRNCSRGAQASIRQNSGIQQVSYSPASQPTYSVPTNTGKQVQVPADVMRELPPGAVIVSDEVVSTQFNADNAGGTYAPALAPVPSRSVSSSGAQWKSAAVNRVAR